VSRTPGAALQRVCALTDLPEAGAVRVVIDGTPVAVVRDEQDTCTPSATPAPRGGLAVEGGRGLLDRVLAARLALRPHHRRADLAAGDPADPRLPADRRRRRRSGRRQLLHERQHRQRTEGELSRMATLEIRDLHVSVDAEQGPKEILRGVDLTVRQGETHAIMGPNGSGKSTLAYSVAGHPKYTVTGGSVTLDGEDLLTMSVDQRARAGLFLAMQYPVEVTGVTVSNFLRTAKAAVDGRAPSLRHWVKDVRVAMDRLRMDPAFAERNVNEGFSGGEKKRHEILQLELLRPKLAILDETDSGLDIDALRIVSEGVNRVRDTGEVGILLITHYTRILRYIRPEFVHVFVDGRIVEEGGPELADVLESEGYDRFTGAGVKG
jgi:Fe-S cluster assembly ATP-binding protein